MSASGPCTKVEAFHRAVSLERDWQLQKQNTEAQADHETQGRVEANIKRREWLAAHGSPPGRDVAGNPREDQCCKRHCDR